MKGHPIFAALYDPLLRIAEAKVLRAIRRELLTGLTGQVLDLGAGTGANLDFYSQEAAITALEPDPYMLKRGQRKSSSAAVAWVEGSAEEIPFDDDSFDAVVATLVLCSVADPQRCLIEARRVLKNHGRFVFLEHVISERSICRGIQFFLDPCWSKIAAGCRLTRDTVAHIQQAGFQIKRMERVVPVAIQPIVYGWGSKKTTDHMAA